MIIHIHLPDDNDTYVLGVVADLLNNGYKITVDLEPTISDDDSVRDIAQMLSAEIDKAFGGDQPIIDLDKRADRQKVYDARYAETEMAQTVPCPSCRASADQPCTTPSGKPYRSFAHVDRISAAHAWIAHQ